MSQIITALLIGITIILAIVFTFFFLSADYVAEKVIVENIKEKPTVKIGVALPLTGNLAMFGESARISIEKAIEDTSKELNYEFIFEDVQNKTRDISIVLNKFTFIDKVDVVMSMWSLYASVISNLAEKNKIIHIGCAWGSDAAKGQYNINNYTSFEDNYNVLMPYLKSKGMNKIGLYLFHQISLVELGEYIEENAPKDGFELVFYNKFNMGEKDFRTDISKMKNEDIDVLFLVANPPEVNIFMKQVRENSWDVPITTIDKFTGVEDLFEGHFYVSSKDGTDTELGKYLKEKDVLNHTCSVNKYNSTKILIGAYEELYKELNRKPNKEEVIEYIISKEKYDSITGELIINEEGHISSTPVMKIIKDGKSVLIEE